MFPKSHLVHLIKFGKLASKDLCHPDGFVSVTCEAGQRNSFGQGNVKDMGLKAAT